MDIDLSGLAATVNVIAGSAVNLEMAVRLGQSLEMTDGLWELVPIVVAAGERLDERPAAEAADLSPAARGLDSATRARLRRLGDECRASLDAAITRQPVDGDALASLTPAEVMADVFGTVGAVIDLPAYFGQALSATANLEGLSCQEMSYLIAYLRQTTVASRTPLLLRALFATAMGTIEPLITRLVQRLMYQAAPQAYSSMADPELDQQVRKACYGPPAMWRDTLVKLGVTVVSDLVDWTTLGQLWEDRNVIAHRGSVVDARHSSATGSEAGTVLQLSPGDVQAAIDQIGAARYALVAATWAHLVPEMAGKIAEGVAGPVLESLRAGRWRQAEGLARVQAAFATGPESAATAMVNRWLATEMGRGHEAIREEVSRWDIAGLPVTFQMARHLLLREDEDGVALLRQLVADGTLSQADLTGWPLFSRLREEGELRDLISG